MTVLCAAAGCTRRTPAERKATANEAATGPVVIRFADPANGAGSYGSIYAYGRREGHFDRALAAVNARIEWVPAAGAFSANFEAMNAGAINASGGAVSPIVGALAHNLKFKIFAISERSNGRQGGIIVPKDSPVRSIADLRGKRVAVNLAAHGDYMLLKALANAHIPATAVERVSIQPPDAAAAFASGKIDGWATFGVFFNTAVKNGAHVLAYEGDLQSDDVTVVAASESVLKQNPRAFQALLRVAQELTEEAHKQPEKFQNVLTDKGPTALSGDRLRLAIEETRELPAPRVPSRVDRQRIQNVATLLYDNHSIDKPLVAEDIVFDVDAAAAAAPVHAAAVTAAEESSP